MAGTGVTPVGAGAYASGAQSASGVGFGFPNAPPPDPRQRATRRNLGGTSGAGQAVAPNMPDPPPPPPAASQAAAPYMSPQTPFLPQTSEGPLDALWSRRRPRPFDMPPPARPLGLTPVTPGLSPVDQQTPVYRAPIFAPGSLPFLPPDAGGPGGPPGGDGGAGDGGDSGGDAGGNDGGGNGPRAVGPLRSLRVNAPGFRPQSRPWEQPPPQQPKSLRSAPPGPPPAPPANMASPLAAGAAPRRKPLALAGAMR